MSNDDVKPETILFVGDSHGDLGFLQWAVDRAVQYNADHIVQVGDFGYWEHTYTGKVFLDKLDSYLESKNHKIHWIDGNHENHTKLRADYSPREDGMIEVRPNIIHIPRGTRWVWGGKTFLGIGGAYSVDKEFRTEGESWWPEEMITEEEVVRCAEGGLADVVVAHDVPMFVDLSYHLWSLGVKPWGWYGESVENRSRLTEVFDAVGPKLFVHGHYHLAYTSTINGCQFVGLDANVNQYGARNWKWNWALSLVSTDAIHE